MMNEPQVPIQYTTPSDVPVSPTIMSIPGAGSPTPRRRWWLWTVLVVVLLGLGGGGYFAYSRGYVSIPFLSPKSDELFSKMIDSIGTINEAQYTIQGHLVAQPRAGNAKPLFVKATNAANTNSSGSVSGSLLGVSGPEDALRYLPADINASGSLTLYGESADTVKDASGMIQLAGSYAGSDSSMQLDVEVRKVKDTTYAIVRKFPGFLFFDFTALKDKWVKIASDDLTGLGLFDVQTIQQTKLKENVEKLRQPLELALKQGVVTVGKRYGNENISGVQSQHIRLAVHSDKIVAFLNAWAEELRKDTSATDQLHNVESIITEVEKPGTLDTLNRVIDHSTIDLWIDRNHSLLRQIQWTFTIIPPDGNEKLKNKQFELQLGLLLEKVNEKVKIDEPNETISFDEAERLMTGVSVESQQFSRQTERVQAIRSALSEYKRLSKSYPDSIANLADDLKKLRDDCVAKEQQQKTNVNANRNTNASGFTIEEISGCAVGLGGNRVISVTDAYTGKPYAYAKDGEDYKLTYQLKITDEIDSYNKDSYADGQNTATSTDQSVEKVTTYEESTKKSTTNTSTNTNTSTITINDADSDGLTDDQELIYGTDSSKTDTDADGLTDFVEVNVYKTNPLVADTDGDSYPDGQEVTNGYNPNGAGKLTSS